MRSRHRSPRRLNGERHDMLAGILAFGSKSPGAMPSAMDPYAGHRGCGPADGAREPCSGCGEPLRFDAEGRQDAGRSCEVSQRDGARSWCVVSARFDAGPDRAIAACVEEFDIRPARTGKDDIRYRQGAPITPVPIAWRLERAISGAPPRRASRQRRLGWHRDGVESGPVRSCSANRSMTRPKRV
jgi:hypothetical protein